MSLGYLKGGLGFLNNYDVNRSKLFSINNSTLFL
jgi:hypothetical protein